MTKHRIKKNDGVGVDFVTPSYPDDPSNTEEGLEFVLGHFQEPIWPRTISTHATQGRQILVFSKEEAHERFKQANYLDCRINAYPNYIEFSGINRQAPNFILIDIDKEQFKSERAFWLAVNKTLQNLKGTLDANPTIIWTGNGVHIYQPLHAIVLEQESIFSRFNKPSQQFLRFAARYLSSNKSDPRNMPTFKSCLVRIPGSHNYKNIRQSNGTANSASKVRIIQRWDRIRPRINPLLYQFYIFLADQKLKEINLQDQLTTIEDRRYQVRHSKSISWIEKLLPMPLQDYRKYAIWRILAPYLMNTQKLPSENAFAIIEQWLDECNKLRRLDFDPKSKIKKGLKGSSRGYFPISLDNLRRENNKLYYIISKHNPENLV